MTFKEFLGLIRLYWKTFAATAVAVLAAGAAWLLLTPLQYVSTAQLLVSLNGTTTADAYQNDDVVAGRVNSYVTLLTSQAVSQRVVDKLGLNISPEALAAKISAVQVPPNTAIIDIAASDRSPSQARRLADTVASEFVIYTDALESPTGEGAQKVKTTVVSEATQPRSRLAEKAALGVLIAMLAALAGAVAVWIRAATDRVVRTPRQAAAAAGAPLLGTVSPGPADSIEALEPYRQLRTRLSGADGPVLQLSPVADDDAVGSVAVNLGRAMVLAGSRCVVVDVTADAAHDAEAGTPGSGADGDPDRLTIGNWAADSGPLAGSRAVGLVERLAGDYESIIVATPSALSDAVASTVSDGADTVALVVAPGAKRADVARAAGRLTATGAPVVGVVATGS